MTPKPANLPPVGHMTAEAPKAVAWQRRFHWPSGLAPTTWGSCTEGEFNAGRKEAALGHYQVRALYAEPVETDARLAEAYLAGWEVSGEGYNHECGGPDKPLEDKYWLTVRDATLRRIK